METLEKTTTHPPVPTTRELTLASVLAAVFTVSTFVPVSAFIGGAGFITLSIMILPVIAALQRPVLAGVTIISGSLGMALLQTSVYPVFGLPGLLVPIVATILGSFAFHHRLGPIVPWSYVLAGAIFYILYAGGTWLWLIPYAVVVMSLPLLFRVKGELRVGLLTLYTTISEQTTMNILSISVLGLVGEVWSLITPFMLFERTVATIGGALIIVALKRRLGESLP